MFKITAGKKLIAILVAAVLLYNSSAYVLVYLPLIQLTKLIISESIEKNKVDEELVKLSFNKTDLAEGKIDFLWKDKHEFRYNESMYDIVDRFETNDSIYFICFLDEKENNLEVNFKKHYEKERTDKNTHSSNRVNLVQQTVDLFSYPASKFFPQISNQNYLTARQYFYSFNNPEVPSPPPKSFLLLG
jgi:hypothetical protein